MQPKYEEKTFENYFNTELDRRSSVYFPFGQVQEGGIGADASSYSRNHWLWRQLGYPYFLRVPFKGADLREIADEMEDHLNREIAGIPSIRANLLFQYKRPEIIASSLGSEWLHWKQKYFRYGIYKEQQELLAHIATKFGNKVLVLYASPTIENINDLVHAKRSGSLIEKTNFRPALDLTGHHRNTFIKAGLHSIACSDPERFEQFDLLTYLERIDGNQTSNVKEQIVEFAKGIRIIAKEDIVLGQAYQHELNIYTEASPEKYPLFFAMQSMRIFKELSGIQWIISINSNVA